MTAEPALTRAARAVVSDPPGRPTSLTLYRDDIALAEVEIDPASAVALASDLLNAARINLGRAAIVEADRDEGGRQ